MDDGLRVTLLTDDGLHTIDLDSDQVERILESVDSEAKLENSAEERSSQDDSDQRTRSEDRQPPQGTDRDPETSEETEQTQERFPAPEDPAEIDEVRGSPPNSSARSEGETEDPQELGDGPIQTGSDESSSPGTLSTETDPTRSEAESSSERLSEGADRPPDQDPQSGDGLDVADGSPSETESRIPPSSSELSTSTAEKPPTVEGGEGTEDGEEDLDPHPLAPDLEPRAYQENAIDAWLEGDATGILNMATGTGKTLTSLFAVDRIWPQARVVVVACPTLVLVDQWREEIRRAFPESAIFKVEKDGPWRAAAPLPEGPTFLLGTYHSISRDWFQTWADRHLDADKTALICDEVHRSGSPTFSKVYEIPSNYRMGLSATPTRDWDTRGNRRIEAALSGEVFYYGLEQAIENGHLVPYTYHVHPLPLMQDERDTYEQISVRLNQLLQDLGFDPDEDSLPTFLEEARAIDEDTVEQVESLLYKRSDILKEAQGKEKHLRSVFAQHDLDRCLVYCNTIDQVRYYAQVLESEGKTPVVYTSEQNQGERRQALQAFERGDIDFIVAIRCLDEGVDIPEAREAILISSSSTVREFVQRRGRLLRPSETKSEATIHDLVVLPVDPDLRNPTLASYEEAAVKKELLRAHIFNRLAVNREENEREIKRFLDAFDVELPLEWIDDASLREALQKSAEEDDLV